MRKATLLPICAAVAAAGMAVLVLAPTAQVVGPAPAVPTSIEVPGAAETSIDHSEPETLPTGRVGAGASREGPAGLPLGFAHSTDGAVSAGTAWLTVIEGPGVLDAARRPALLSAIGDTTFATAAEHRIAERATALGLPGNGRPSTGYVTAVARPERGAYRVLQSSQANARIEIWYPYQLAVLSDGSQPGAARWLRARAVLRWDGKRADWRLAADLTFSDGPDPGGQQPSFIDRAQVLSSSGSGWHLYATAQE
jgi:hypothetical protein